MKTQTKALICMIMAIVMLFSVVIVIVFPGITYVFTERLPSESQSPKPQKQDRKETYIEKYYETLVSTVRNEGRFELEVFSSDGVELTYNKEEFNVLGVSQYNVFTFLETKDLTVTAEFKDGWTYSEDYTFFFESDIENVEVKTHSDGTMTFIYHAVEGGKVRADELDCIGIYATPDNLPKLSINVDMEFKDINKQEWVTAQFTLTNGTKEFESSDYAGIGEVKGRGNSSWKRPKKGYSIKLSEPASLLGIPETKKYAIIANYDDDSLMRNYITYKASQLLTGMSYIPKCEFVEVYLNGNYNGVYLLVERIDVSETKLNLGEGANGADISGDYLIEKDIDEKVDFERDLWFNSPYWANQSRDYFALKYPEVSDSILKERFKMYLTEYMEDVHQAVMGESGESYTQYVDVDSWVDFIIMQEITKNIDGNLKTSCYMYKLRDDDRLYMATLWDFDRAYGNASWDNADRDHNDYDDCPTGVGVADFMTINSSCPWFKALYYNHPEFREEIEKKYAQYRQTIIPKMRQLIYEQAAYLGKAYSANDELWGTSFHSGVDELANWLNGRVNWLDGQWLDDMAVIPVNVAANASGGCLKFDMTYENHPFIGIMDGNRHSVVSNIAGMDNFESGFRLVLEMKAGEQLTFDYRVSSEKDYDKLFFKVDDRIELVADGEIDWTSYCFVAQEDGTYEFRWSYKKDYSNSEGSDCAWIDNITYSGCSTEYEKGDVNLDGIIDMSDVLLLVRYVNGCTMLDEYALPVADYNDDGIVDEHDIEMLFNDMNEKASVILSEIDFGSEG